MNFSVALRNGARMKSGRARALATERHGIERNATGCVVFTNRKHSHSVLFRKFRGFRGCGPATQQIVHYAQADKSGMNSCECGDDQSGPLRAEIAVRAVVVPFAE